MDTVAKQARRRALEAVVGTRLRFFSERVFGAWVDGVVASATEAGVVIDASFHGARWRERKALGCEFYRPHGHAQAGDAFRLADDQPALRDAQGARAAVAGGADGR
jgi:hypothetical protein